MQKIILFIFFSAVFDLAAQRVIDVSKEDAKNIVLQSFYVVGGEPFSNVQYIKIVEGTPFFNEKWMKGTVYFEDGTGYTGLFLKIDMLKGNVHYMGADEAEYIVDEKLKRVVLTDTVTSKSFEFIHSDYWKNEQLARGWYQVLMEGNASLYKLDKKIISENKRYGSSTAEQKIETSPLYVVKYKEIIVPVKKWKDLPDIFTDHKKEIYDYIRQNGLNGKSQAHYINVIDYYNGLQ